MGRFLLLQMFCIFLCGLDSGAAQASRAECRFTKSGTSYMGTVTSTRSGRTCQAWTLQSPHQHGYMDAVYFPDEHMANVSNYCRNPNKDFNGVWCYTTDPLVIKEYCDISMCDCKTTTGGHEYLGTMSGTRSGKTCQRWDTQTPHSHAYHHGSYFADGNVTLAGNHCRNPDSDWNSGPWCYTTDENTRWEMCDIPMCDCVPNVGSDYYLGQLSVTRSGYTCQRWDSQTPHSHQYNYDSYFSDGSVTAANNHCRNPDLSKPDGPWCYTMEADVEWEYCHVPDCQYEPPPLTTMSSSFMSTTPSPSTDSMTASPVMLSTITQTMVKTTTFSSASTSSTVSTTTSSNAESNPTQSARVTGICTSKMATIKSGQTQVTSETATTKPTSGAVPKGLISYMHWGYLVLSLPFMCLQYS